MYFTETVSSLKRILRVGVIALFAGLVLVACGHDDDDPESFVRFLHAISDAPRVNIFVNDRLLLSDVDFRTGTRFLGLAPNNANIRVEAIIPDGNIDIVDEDVILDVNKRSTVIVAGSVDQSLFQPLVIENTTDPVPAGSARIVVTHGAADAPPVYIAAITPRFPVDQATFLGPFSFTETTDPVVIPEGPYQILVAVGTPPFDVDDVIFQTDTIFFPSGADFQAVAVNSTVPADNNPDGSPKSPISVVLLDGSGSQDIFDTKTGADLRVVHNSKGAPGVNVIVDDLNTGVVEALEIVTNLEFGEFAGYLDPSVPPSLYGVDVALNSDPTIVPLSFEVDLMPGMAYTAIANNEVAQIEEWVLIDDNRRVATEVKARIVHGAPSVGTVDLYVLPSSAGLLPADTDPTVPNFQFGTETGFVSLPADTYDIYVTAAGGDTPAISVTGIPLDANGIYTAIARDPLDGETEPGLILLDDFNP